MAAPVWSLSVDLNTKTATFQSGLADAAKSARGAFTEIKSGASEMGGHVSTNMFASRHAIMAASEAFGDTMPRAITALLVHIGPLGAALEAAFPFAAIGLAAVLLVEHLSKLREAGVKLTLDQERFGTAVQNAFNSLDQKLLQAEIRSDELRNNHLGALSKQLELINKQSMADLAHQFLELAKVTEVTFGDLESHWYKIGIGAAGAKHALDEFQAKYEDLLAKGKDKEASDLLRGTLESARQVLALQNQIRKLEGHDGPVDVRTNGYDKLAAARAALQKAGDGVGSTKDEVKAQEALVGLLEAQEGVQARIARLKTVDSSNATTATGNEASAKSAEAARQAADHQMKMGEQSLAAERELAQVSATIHQGTIAERLASDTKVADDEFRIQLAGNGAQMMALDKTGKDYNEKLRALQDKTAELIGQHENAVAILRGKTQIEQYRLDLQNMEEAEREKLNETREGSAARLAAIDTALKAEAALNLQDTAHYRELLSQRVAVARQSALEESQQRVEAALVAIEADEKSSASRAAGAADAAMRQLQVKNASIAEIEAAELAAANEEYRIQQNSYIRQLQELSQFGDQYAKKIAEIHGKQATLEASSQKQIADIQSKADADRAKEFSSAMIQMETSAAQGLASMLMGHRSFAQEMSGILQGLTQSMISAAIQQMNHVNSQKLSNAKLAASNVYGQVSGWPVVGPFLAPELAAAAFAGVMAFEKGGIVPGYGVGDTVPAMLTPGEGVVPRNTMAALQKMVESGSMGGGDTHLHAHVRPTYKIQALDGVSLERVLQKHHNTLEKHFKNTLRKMGHA